MQRTDFAVFLFGDHDRIAILGLLQQHGLNFFQFNPMAVEFDLTVPASFIFQFAVAVDARQIAAVIPLLILPRAENRGGSFRIVQITRPHAFAADPQLSGLHRQTAVSRGI